MADRRRYDDELYNGDIKKRFLNSLLETTVPSYRRAFLISKRTEERLGKDLYDFRLEDIEYVLYDASPSTFVSSHVLGRIITSYITWAIEEGLRRNKINPLWGVGPEFFQRFVDKKIELYLSDEKLRQLENWCVNAQDAVILRLLFEGVRGREYSELRNIKKSDISIETNVLRLVNEGNKVREIELSDRAIKLLLKAAGENIYYKRNGEIVEDNRIRSYTDLVNNEYVLRSSLTRTFHLNEPIDAATINRRITSLRRIFDIPRLTPTNIAKSGMIKMAYDLVGDGEITANAYKEIAHRFNVNNWYSLKTYVTRENIEKLYGVALKYSS